MVRKQSKGARGPGMANAQPTRYSRQLVSYEESEEGLTTAEVPYDLLLKKKAAKYGVVSARRAMMRAKMSERCGVTGFGCVPGCIAKIVYPLTEVEATLLNTMGEANAVEAAGDVALGGVPQI